jgi:hypothetical protein
MDTRASANFSLAVIYSIPLLQALIGAGPAGNYFLFSIFLAISFLFGSIFALPALQCFDIGPCRIGHYPRISIFNFSVPFVLTKDACFRFRENRCFQVYAYTE